MHLDCRMPGMRHGSYRRVAVRLVECVPRAKHVVAVRAWWRARIECVNCEVSSHYRLIYHELCDRAKSDNDAGWRSHCTTHFLLPPHVAITQSGCTVVRSSSRRTSGDPRGHRCEKALRYFRSAEGTCTKSYRRQAQTSDKEIGV